MNCILWRIFLVEKNVKKIFYQSMDWEKKTHNDIFSSVYTGCSKRSFTTLILFDFVKKHWKLSTFILLKHGHYIHLQFEYDVLHMTTSGCVTNFSSFHDIFHNISPQLILNHSTLCANVLFKLYNCCWVIRKIISYNIWWK